MLVMEMVSGGSLDVHLQKEAAHITKRDRLRYSIGAAKGLEYLHENDCLHRDVAARNCLVHKGDVKLSDFGLSRELSNRAKKYKLKDMKQRLPIRWLAPEVLSSGTYSKKSDVYSFGILLWEIYTDGQTPYSDMSVVEVTASVCSFRNTMRCVTIIPSMDLANTLKEVFGEVERDCAVDACANLLNSDIYL